MDNFTYKFYCHFSLLTLSLSISLHLIWFASATLLSDSTMFWKLFLFLVFVLVRVCRVCLCNLMKIVSHVYADATTVTDMNIIECDENLQRYRIVTPQYTFYTLLYSSGHPQKAGNIATNLFSTNWPFALCVVNFEIGSTLEWVWVCVCVSSSSPSSSLHWTI